MKPFWLLACISISGTALADINYTVDVLPDAGTLHVTIFLAGTGKGTNLQLPNWAPGAYVMRDGSGTIHNLKATGPAGESLSISKSVVTLTTKYQDGADMKTASHPVTTWTVVPAKSTKVEYDVDSRPVDGAVHWGGPATYLYETNRRHETCRLHINVPSGWSAYTGMMEAAAGKYDYAVKDYDTLADNPVSAGGPDGLTVDTYTSRGKTCTIVMRGAPKANVDRPKLIKACKFVTDMETDLFHRSAPFDKYVWHFAVNKNADGAGGLEHLSSTEITLAQGVGPRAVSVLAHESFHLWNVKRIRSKPLGPFDYTHLPETGAIWWLEGVTDYYAYTLLHRYGWTDDASYLADAVSNYNIAIRAEGFKTVSPNESSMRVDEANSGRGNSNGYLISYYNLGWLAGMCLDIELRTRTNGKHNLDDVELALWDLCKDGKPGFAEDEIRKQCIRFGGPEMGAAYDRVVMQPQMPVAEELAKVGLDLAATPEEYSDAGFDLNMRFGGTGAMGIGVTRVHGPAEGKLQDGDRIIGVNGQDLESIDRADLMNALAPIRAPKAGAAVQLKIRRGDSTLDVEVTPVTATRNVYSIKPLASATEAQKKAAEGWLAKKAIG